MDDTNDWTAQIPRCPAITRLGFSCRFRPRKATGFCVNHDPAFALQQKEHRDRGTKAATRRREFLALNLEPFDLADRASVQALLEAVIRLELTGQISVSRSRNLLRALSIAARNFPTGLERQDARRYSAMKQSLNHNLLAIVDYARRSDSPDRPK